jgi:hypothetical protein
LSAPISAVCRQSQVEGSLGVRLGQTFYDVLGEDFGLGVALEGLYATRSDLIGGGILLLDAGLLRLAPRIYYVFNSEFFGVELAIGVNISSFVRGPALPEPLVVPCTASLALPPAAYRVSYSRQYLETNIGVVLDKAVCLIRRRSSAKCASSIGADIDLRDPLLIRERLQPVVEAVGSVRIYKTADRTRAELLERIPGICCIADQLVPDPSGSAMPGGSVPRIAFRVDALWFILYAPPPANGVDFQPVDSIELLAARP